MKSLKKFNKLFKDWKVFAVDHSLASPQDVGGYDTYREVFLVAYIQNTACPSGTIWNDEFLFELEESLEQFLEYVEDRSQQ